MQIKVKDTRMHKVIKYNEMLDMNFNNEIPVAEGKHVLVECKPEEALVIKLLRSGEFLPTFGSTVEIIKTPCQYFRPIIISETEKIEVEDNYYDPHYPGNLRQGTNNTIPGGYKKKILVMPNQFSPKHLQAIVEGKLKDGDKVLVECEHD